MQFSSTPLEEHREAPSADDGALAEAIARWERRSVLTGDVPTSDAQRTCLVVIVYVGKTGRQSEGISNARADELCALVVAQGDVVVATEHCHLRAPDPRALFRKGMATDLAELAAAMGADTLVVDAELTPSQCRNLEDSTGLAVRDREGIILNVFQRRARTRKARIQIAMAHLEYLRPRIRGLGLIMDQQAGGIVGSRGPGETVSELLARQIDERLARLRASLKQVARDSQTQRQRRSQCTRIALVGYTNAGKTTIMNGLTEARLSAANRPFETLDTTSRSLSRHGGDVLISDTVGFIRDLPERLFESFASTLEEVSDADLLVMAVDISDEEHAMHLEQTERILARLDAHRVPRFYVFTKLDACETPPHAAYLAGLSDEHPYMILDARDEAQQAALRSAILAAARTDHERLTLDVPYAFSEVVQSIYARCRVVESEAHEESLRITFEGQAKDTRGIARALALAVQRTSESHTEENPHA